MDVSPETPKCGICGQPLEGRHDHGDGDSSRSREGKRIEYVVTSQRGATVHYQAVGDPSRTYKTGATGLADQLGIEEESLVGRNFSCWVEPAEYGVVRRDFRLL